jgi:hypothetical protein
MIRGELANKGTAQHRRLFRVSIALSDQHAVWLTRLSESLGRPATLEDIPDSELDALAEKGFDWVWLLSVWQTGPAAQRVSRSNAAWRKEFEQTLPDLREEDIAGSGFAIQSYSVHRELGGVAALARLRRRMQGRGLKLMLDFVPRRVRWAYSRVTWRAADEMTKQRSLFESGSAGTTKKPSRPGW